jgi:hypothetical protein
MANEQPEADVINLSYRFLTLPIGIQIQVVQGLGLFRDEDRGITDPELYHRVSRRAIEENKVDRLRAAVEAGHAGNVR